MTVNQLIKRLEEIQTKYGKTTKVVVNLEEFSNLDSHYTHWEASDVDVEYIPWEGQESEKKVVVIS